jgi:hypothetical protein
LTTGPQRSVSAFNIAASSAGVDDFDSSPIVSSPSITSRSASAARSAALARCTTSGEALAGR